MTVTHVDLRQALWDFLGDERFRKFVATGFRRGRLRFWQEREWLKFVASHPHFDVPLQQLQAALNICHVHGLELLPDTVPTFFGDVDFTMEYAAARLKLFPHANTGPVAASHPHLAGDRVAVWFCPACRAAKSKWTSL